MSAKVKEVLMDVVEPTFGIPLSKGGGRMCVMYRFSGKSFATERDKGWWIPEGPKLAFPPCTEDVDRAGPLLRTKTGVEFGLVNQNFGRVGIREFSGVLFLPPWVPKGGPEKFWGSGRPENVFWLGGCRNVVMWVNLGFLTAKVYFFLARRGTRGVQETNSGYNLDGNWTEMGFEWNAVELCGFLGISGVTKQRLKAPLWGGLKPMGPAVSEK